MKKINALNRPNTAVIYVRVSSQEQVGGYSLSDQERIDTKYAKDNQWEVLKVFREEGESAKTADRTQMNAMREYCLKNVGKVGYIIVYKADRFSRNTMDHALLRKFFRDCGVELKSATEPIEDTPYGRFFELMLSGIANLENDVRTEKTITGMRSKALDGYWPWGAPWGYKNVELMGKRRIILDEERGKIAKFVCEEFNRGATSFRELADKVNLNWDAKSKHGLKMSKQLVYKILTNPFYCGKIAVPGWGIEVEGKHDAIISEKLFLENQDIIAGNKKSRKQPRNRNNPDFPLRGVECVECRKNLTGGFTKGNGGKYPYYSHGNKFCSKRGSIHKDKLENSFTEFLSLYTPDIELMDALTEAIIVVHEKEKQSNIQQGGKFEKKLKKLDEEMEELLQLRLDRVIESREYSIENDKRKKKKSEPEMLKNNLANSNPDIEYAVKFGTRLIKELPTTWQMLESGELKALRALLFPKNIQYMYPGFKTTELSPIYKVKAASGTDVNRLVTSRRFELRLAD